MISKSSFHHPSVHLTNANTIKIRTIKNQYLIITLLVLCFFGNACKTKREKESTLDVSTLETAYLGQRPPGTTPEIFAPGIVSIDGRFEGTVAFSPDYSEMYFAAENKDKITSIYFSKLKYGQWTPIKKVDFTQNPQ